MDQANTSSVLNDETASLEFSEKINKSEHRLGVTRQILSMLLKVINFPLLIASLLLNKIQLFLNWVRFRYIEFVVKPDDIFIVTYPRSGTTWVQMILHQLTSDGDLNFNHISERIPWFERFYNYEKILPNLPEPRIFKSHMSYSGFFSIPKGDCKYIYILRNPGDVLVSYYYFYINFLGFRGSFDQFYQMFMKGRVQYGSWFKHVHNWRSHAKNINILFLNYEDLKQDLEREIRKIADFCEIEVPEERMSRILERSSFKYMKENQSKFDHLTEVLAEAGIHSGTFIRSGKVGESKEYLNEKQKSEINLEERKYQLEFVS